MKSFKVYSQLFTASFYLSSFTFGGGYVIIPLLRKKFVDDLEWIDDEEMMNLTAIAQSTPGSLAVNASVLIGYKIDGIKGALVTTLGTVLPPLIILSIISLFYVQFKENTIIAAALHAMQAGVAAIIVEVVFTMTQDLLKTRVTQSLLVLIVSFIASYFFKINVIYIILAAGMLGVFKPIRKDDIL